MSALRPALILAAALVAGATLVLSGIGDEPPATPPPPPARLTLAAAWPAAERGTMGDSDFVPDHFLDAHTAVGTALSRDRRSLLLLVRRGDGSSRQLRTRPAKGDVSFGSFAASTTDLVWTESAGGQAPEIWTADLRDARAPARRLTTDTGEAILTGSQYDLLVHDNRVYWVAAAAGSAEVTEIRSVPMAGGPVTITTQPGSWSLSAWPWLTDGSDQVSVARLRDHVTGRDLEIRGSGTELLTCGPVWCRVTVVGSGGVARTDLIRHDGSNRTTIADGNATPVGADVAVLDRFDLFFQTRANPGQNNAAALLIHDLTGNRTVEAGSDVTDTFVRAGVVWWSADDAWHTLDLRTITP